MVIWVLDETMSYLPSMGEPGVTQWTKTRHNPILSHILRKHEVVLSVNALKISQSFVIQQSAVSDVTSHTGKREVGTGRTPIRSK